jgi:uncharacterized membrane protein
MLQTPTKHCRLSEQTNKVISIVV